MHRATSIIRTVSLDSSAVNCIPLKSFSLIVHVVQIPSPALMDMSSSNNNQNIDEVVPEAYVHILARCLPTLPSGEQIPYRWQGAKSREGHVINAIAACLVSKATKEAYAVAFRQGAPKTSTLYIASDDADISQETKDHCRAIYRSLCEISEIHHIIRFTSLTDEAGQKIASDLSLNFHLRLIQHAFPKVTKRMEKLTEEVWLAYKVKKRNQVNPYLLPVFERLIKLIDGFREAVRGQDLRSILSLSSSLALQVNTEKGKDLLDIGLGIGELFLDVCRPCNSIHFQRTGH